jgi:glutamine amidotransferase
LQQPVLGICLGMQLLFDSSEEDDARLIGLIPARLQRLPDRAGLRVPHMGWNAVSVRRRDPLTESLDGKWFYFVHSFAAPVGDWTLATSEHGRPFSAMVRQGNFCGAQFHPERSASAGAALLRRFMETAGE